MDYLKNGLRQFVNVVLSGSAVVLLTMAPASADGWSLNKGKLSSGVSYVDAIVSKGRAVLSLSCRRDFDHIRVHLENITMPRSALIDDAEGNFMLHFDMGAGIYVREGFRASYFAPDKVWGGELRLDLSQLDALGGAKRVIVTRPDRKVAGFFSAKGSRKVEQAMRKLCFPHYR